MSKTFGSPFNFLVKELENLRWEELKMDLGIEPKPVWGKQAKHAIDAGTYILATIHKPKTATKTPRPMTGLIKLFPWLGA
jgi:hypothetical protein